MRQGLFKLCNALYWCALALWLAVLVSAMAVPLIGCGTSVHPAAIPGQSISTVAKRLIPSICAPKASSTAIARRL